MRRLLQLSPFFVFLLVCFFLYRGLFLHPRDIPSALLDQPSPALDLPSLKKPHELFSTEQMRGKVWLLNVWATWCAACREEHPVMMDIAREQVPIIGMDYKDNITQAKAWLIDYGSPYENVVFDQEGEKAIDWGVYGAPETFVIDGQGVIRYKHLGVMTHKVWTETIKPIYQKLVSQSQEQGGS